MKNSMELLRADFFASEMWASNSAEKLVLIWSCWIPSRVLCLPWMLPIQSPATKNPIIWLDYKPLVHKFVVCPVLPVFPVLPVLRLVGWCVLIDSWIGWSIIISSHHHLKLISKKHLMKLLKAVTASLSSEDSSEFIIKPNCWTSFLTCPFHPPSAILIDWLTDWPAQCNPGFWFSCS